MEKNNSIKLVNIVKNFGKIIAVDNLSLNAKKGEFISFLGPSGCGKTTLLRIIAGLEQLDSGKILINDMDMTRVPAHRRPINMVFQSYGLFPHMNVYDNIAFGSRISKWPESQIREGVESTLKLVGLEGFEIRSPKQLSGGQKQRVAVARALINKPEVLLLDEPLGALDLQIRKQMQIELKKIHYELKSTFIYVTHDQEEALVMSDRIVVMSQGKITQIGTPKEIYNNPVNTFTAKFIGESNLFEIKVLALNKNNIQAKLGETKLLLEKSQDTYSKGNTAFVLIRPESINIFGSKEELKYDNIFEVTINVSIFLGNDIKYEVTDKNNNIFNIRNNYRRDEKIFNIGDSALIGFNKEDIIIIRY